MREPQVSAALTADLVSAETVNAADRSLAEAANAAGRTALSTYDVTYNTAGGQKKHKKLARLR